MVVCPVCEHSQAGGPECEVCGRRFEGAPDAGAVAAPAPLFEGLEPTSRPEAVAVPGELVVGLEPNQAAAVQVPPSQPFPEIEQTRRAPVEVAVVVIPDVERTGDAVPAEEPTPYPAVVVCRYCRTEAAPGEKLCSRCGMRLPTVAAAALAASAGGEEDVHLCGCGTPVRGPRCPSCGARRP